MSPRVLARVLLSVVAGVLCGVVAACVVVLLDAPRDPDVVDLAPPAPSERPGAVGATGRAREALRAWDRARARAWTTADPRALAALYADGSVAGRRDVAMLRAWSERGTRVTRLTTQVLRLQVLVERPRRLVLVVTDRVALVQAGDLRLTLDRASTRQVVLVAGRDGWRVASVSDRPAPS